MSVGQVRKNATSTNVSRMSKSPTGDISTQMLSLGPMKGVSRRTARPQLYGKAGLSWMTPVERMATILPKHTTWPMALASFVPQPP